MTSEPSPPGSFDPAAAMQQMRRVMISGPLTAATVTEGVARLMTLDGESAEPVSLIVNSAGGTLEEASPLIDTITLMQGPVAVDVLGQAHEAAGVLVVAAPGERRIGSSASISLRLGPVGAGAAQDAAALERMAHAAQSLQQRVAATAAARSGQTVDWVIDQFARGSIFNPQEAVQLGLVDGVR